MEQAAAILRNGGLVALPTETVYGLGANALDARAVARIYEVKGRPATSPLIVHVCSVEMARGLARVWSAEAGALAARFWPGPLTMVVPKREVIPDIVTAGLDTVGLRLPAHEVMREVIRRAGVPVAAPSANRFT
ncbi:MAG: threonylcarbamoyl-AMP synthase, partial [Bryobacterales bacterium]|nr:threonylcarbamoyl-AMP synthase [Bryobacterales bacterium]